MNFLAHFYLSGDDEGLLIGNFIADAVKGKDYQQYPGPVKNGILLHRAIDHFTDTHPVSSAARSLIRTDFNHYSGVVLDVFYDHFLARQWEQFHPEPLAAYSERIYATLEQHMHGFPEKPKYMLPFMKEHNWLMAYAHLEGVDRVMGGMSRRAKFESHMENAGAVLRRHYAELEAHFSAFFPELITHVKNFRASE